MNQRWPRSVCLLATSPYTAEIEFYATSPWENYEAASNHTLSPPTSCLIGKRFRQHAIDGPGTAVAFCGGFAKTPAAATAVADVHCRRCQSCLQLALAITEAESVVRGSKFTLDMTGISCFIAGSMKSVSYLARSINE